MARILADSPFFGSGIEPNDHVVAVNGLYCSNFSVERVTAMMMQTSSNNKLSLCVHNRHGDSTRVCSSIIKPQPTCKVGIILRRKGDVIRVKELADDSLFQDSLITARQRCLSINGVPCDQLTAHSASQIIGAAKDRVTMISEIEEHHAVILAAHGAPVAWWQSLIAVPRYHQQ